MVGWQVKKFRLAHVEFQVAMGHQSRNASQAIGDAGLNSWGEFRNEKLELDVIGVEVMILKTGGFIEVTWG